MRQWLKMVKKNSSIEWAKVVAPVFSALVVAGVGSYYTYQSAENTNAKEYIKIAVGIIEAPKSEYNENMREWATELINHYSPVKFKPELQIELINGSATPKHTSSFLNDERLQNLGREYEFKWDYREGYEYKLTVEAQINSKWELVGGISTRNNTHSLLVPYKRKLRWNVTSYETEGKKIVTMNWKYLDPIYL